MWKIVYEQWAILTSMYCSVFRKIPWCFYELKDSKEKVVEFGLRLRRNEVHSEHEVREIINNGNRTEWSPIRSVIVRVINKIGRPQSGGFSQWVDLAWLAALTVRLKVSDYGQLSDYNFTEWSVKCKAADATITFEGIVMVMIRRETEGPSSLFFLKTEQ